MLLFSFIGLFFIFCVNVCAEYVFLIYRVQSGPVTKEVRVQLLKDAVTSSKKSTGSVDKKAGNIEVQSAAIAAVTAAAIAATAPVLKVIHKYHYIYPVYSTCSQCCMKQ